MKKTLLSILPLAFLVLTSCNGTKKSGTAVATEATPVTVENYALAETQVIFKHYADDIAAETHSKGTGYFLHNRDASNPKDTTVMRVNFDTRYSFALLDLTKEATLVMPETNGRYQSAWFITEEHYNPMAIVKPGTYTINQENMGNRYVMVVVRTQVNMKDEADMKAVTELQDKIQLIQAEKGEYVPSHTWKMDEILSMREKYQQLVEEKHMSIDIMFGKKGEVTEEAHNCGVAYGWGGLTKDQAIYLTYLPEDVSPATLTLKDVPVADNAFWSITVYDKNGFPKGEPFNINSSFVKKNADGSATIHFGGDKTAENYMHIYEGWGFVLRMYLPQQAYFDGTWKQPELVNVK